ncbi:hypothetical protein GQ43DRAFT_12121 [Delitschia confertaspora ATCC 74209]|uniref:Uncharacterized protein n=1 Tax=Delitschia confertaspora ATCC 74209 TaxID=1513339 RepID=A0A9P4JMH7_9PLEO|nr:hypothetical protein GQ43DRAFT_12121 [Delitschia confertaspora ATCC 74209]
MLRIVFSLKGCRKYETGRISHCFKFLIISHKQTTINHNTRIFSSFFFLFLFWFPIFLIPFFTGAAHHYLRRCRPCWNSFCSHSSQRRPSKELLHLHSILQVRK